MGKAFLKVQVDLSGEVRLHLKGVALIKGFEALQSVQSNFHTLIFSQNSACKARSLHLQHLIHEDIAKGPDIGLEAFAPSEHDRLGKGPSIGEFGEVQFDALDALKVHQTDIDVVAHVEGLKAIGTDVGRVGWRLGDWWYRACAKDVHGWVQRTVGSRVRTWRA